ncbi:diacylglycerol/lipid kinase family protein [Reyranella soli]|uniref:Lipid kinase n=1 Tax=Reyranella soli TaxID=1230389 RepID=A0A512NLV8_9HYPH|nr:diacylglycerol kinase family protein [Reyranella soli]GEP59931.1 lipid kinase [Reyranella soli]
MRVAVIVNPAARKGGALARWPAIQAELDKRLGPVEPMFTEAPGHATHLALNALARGVRRFVAVGGDGTVNETLNGLLEPSGRLIYPDAVLCPVPAGTANELSRALGHLAVAGSAFDAAASPLTRPIDLMRVRCAGPDGRPVDRFGYLIVALGLAATISHRTSQSRWLKKLGEVAYLLMTPGVTLGYRQRDISVEIDGVPTGTRRLFTVMVGNTENGGGGMKLLPGARFDDGVLDLIEAGGVSRLEVLTTILPKLYSGAHVHHPKVRTARGTSFRFASDVETLVDLDGEMVGRLPLEVTVLPQAFRVGTV